MLNPDTARVTVSPSSVANAVISELNGSMILGRFQLTAMPVPKSCSSVSDPKSKNQRVSPVDFETHRVFFGPNLPESTTKSNVMDHFNEFAANITNVQLIHDRSSRKFKGYGFITFSSAASAHAAIKALNHSTMLGVSIKVSPDKYQQKQPLLHEVVPAQSIPDRSVHAHTIESRSLPEQSQLSSSAPPHGDVVPSIRPQFYTQQIPASDQVRALLQLPEPLSPGQPLQAEPQPPGCNPPPPQLIQPTPHGHHGPILHHQPPPPPGFSSVSQDQHDHTPSGPPIVLFPQGQHWPPRPPLYQGPQGPNGPVYHHSLYYYPVPSYIRPGRPRSVGDPHCPPDPHIYPGPRNYLGVQNLSRQCQPPNHPGPSSHLRSPRPFAHPGPPGCVPLNPAPPTCASIKVTRLRPTITKEKLYMHFKEVGEIDGDPVIHSTPQSVYAHG